MCDVKYRIQKGPAASILGDSAWIVRACDLTRALAARGVKLLGSCFGHQMLGRALQASYLESMPDRRDVLLAGWHAEPRDDRIASAILRAFLET